MSATVVITTLFPHDGVRRAPRSPSSGRLAQLAAIGWALVPLAVMGQMFARGA